MEQTYKFWLMIKWTIIVSYRMIVKESLFPMTDAPLTFVKFWVNEVDVDEENDHVRRMSNLARRELTNRYNTR